MLRSLLLVLALGGAVAAEEKSFLKNGEIDGKDGWSFNGGGEGTSHDYDAERGALHIEKTAADKNTW